MLLLYCIAILPVALQLASYYNRDLLAKDRSWIDPVSILAILTNTIQDRSRIDTSGIIAEPANSIAVGRSINVDC
jgi:hypothetical protein